MAKVAQYNLNELTKQEVFTLARKHILEQGVPSMRGGECMYANDGLCCAAAPFLPSYDPDMEGSTWDNLRKEEFLDGCTSEFDSLLLDLQGAHDGASFISNVPEKYIENVSGRLAEVAIKYGLENE